MNEKVPETNPDYFPCGHCHGNGACTTGKDGASCEVCTKEGKVKKDSVGVVCSVCGGIGVAEMKTGRINKRIASILALLIVYVALFMVGGAALLKNVHIITETLHLF